MNNKEYNVDLSWHKLHVLLVSPIIRDAELSSEEKSMWAKHGIIRYKDLPCY